MEGVKKNQKTLNLWSWSHHTGGGGDRRVCDHTSLGYFFNSPNNICLALEGPKTNFVLTSNYIFLIYSNLVWPLELNFPLLFVEIFTFLICAVLPPFTQKFQKNIFHNRPSNSIIRNKLKYGYFSYPYST